MRIPKLLLPVVSMLTACFIIGQSATRNTVRIPDFAYPETVDRQARTRLQQSLRDHSGPGTVRALMDITLAQGAIANNNIAGCLNLCDSVHALPQNDAVTRSMINMLRASILNSIYSSEQWRFDHRQQPDGPRPTDYNEWSGEQFRSAITELIDSAMTATDTLATIPTKAWSNVVTTDRDLLIYYPTLLDYMAQMGIEIMQGWSYPPHIFSTEAVSEACRPSTEQHVPLLRRDATGQRILELYAAILTRSDIDSAPYVNAILGRAKWMVSHMASDNFKDDEGRFLRHLYDCYLSATGSPVCQWAGEILLEIPYDDSRQNKKEMYHLYTAFLKYCPSFSRADCVRQRIDRLASPSLQVTAPAAVEPGTETALKVELTNVAHATIRIYDVSADNSSRDGYSLKAGQLPPLAGSVTVSAANTERPFSETCEARFTFPRPGCYIAVPVVDGKIRYNEYYQKIHATRVALSSSRYTATSIWANDAVDGSPLPGVRLTLTENPYGRNGKTVTLGMTDSIGSLPLLKGSGLINAALGNDRYAIGVYADDHRFTPSDKWTFAAHGFPSLPIYHPGDTAEWVAVCYEYKGGLRRPVAGREVTCVITDAGGVSIDTLKVTTDRYGRVRGETPLPTGSLTGRYNVKVENTWSTLTFEVSDYKMPTFRVDDVTAETDSPEAGCVTLRGRVMTYAGVPLADARVTAFTTVSRRYRWWNTQQYDLTTDSSSSDADGYFTITIPADVMAASPLPGGTYRAEITALSPAGESQTARVVWGSKSRYAIHVEAPATANIAKGLMIKARLTDYQDSTVNRPVNVELIAPDSTVKKHAPIHGVTILETAGLPQGTYTLRFTAEQADTVTQECILYDHSAATSPVPGRLIFLPGHEITTDADGRGELIFATDCPTHVRVSLWTPDSVISEKWHAVGEGFSRLPVTLPAGIDEATVSYQLTGRYRQESGSLAIRRPERPSLKIVAETFRDRTLPGAAERWTLRITDQSGSGCQAAVIADMYNTALDALTSTGWHFSPRSGALRSLRWNESGINSAYTFYYTPPTPQTARYKCLTPAQPDFDTYGRSWTAGRFFRKVMMSRSSAVKAEAADGMADEIFEEEVAMVAYDAAPAMGMADAGEAKMAVNGAMTTEEMAVEETEQYGEGSNVNPADNTYREAEIPLAFFMPQLTTDREGRVTLQFTVPDANTTWGLRAVAWTESLMTASLSRNVTASKPVMVQPNLPRFMRAGDDLVIPATIINATDTPQDVTSIIELFNPADGKVLETTRLADTLAPGAQQTVAVSVNAPEGMAFIGYRIKTGNGEYSDGEQALIPILPASTPVFETVPFYMPPDEKEFEMKLPKLDDDAAVTLQFCENPTWYIVTALPGLIQGEATTATEAARSIFSAATARGLLTSYPQIAEALKQWATRQHDTDMLTSMLNRNPELKSLLLSATPWMLDARNDNERMARLALLFDQSTIDKTLGDNIATLKKLRVKQAGWSWTARFPEPSQWATREVLRLIGQTARLGYMPPDRELKEMVSEALKWDTERTLEQLRKYPQSDFTDYVELHDMYRPVGIGAPDTRIADAATQMILRTWKQAPLTVKARYARILNDNHYPRVAGEIVASICQYGVSTPQSGMHFPSTGDNGQDEISATAAILQAIHTVDPTSSAIDPIRQWLILQKGLQNWGDATTATAAVTDILTTSPRWIDAARGAVIHLGNIKLDMNRSNALTGELEISTTGKNVSGKRLSIKRAGDTPAWGAVYTRSTQMADNVAPAACTGLSIEKTILTADGATMIATDSLHIGDKVIVRLTVKATDDLDYVVITDDRAACLEPVGQLSASMSVDGLTFYRENRDSQTRIFIDRLPRGTYVLTYPMWVNNRGECISGIATVQSQYAPRFTAHSSGSRLWVK